MFCYSLEHKPSIAAMRSGAAVRPDLSAAALTAYLIEQPLVVLSQYVMGRTDDLNEDAQISAQAGFVVNSCAPQSTLNSGLSPIFG